MYYVKEINASLVISVNRLDRDKPIAIDCHLRPHGQDDASALGAH
jgi:hypothetical protein